MTYAEQLYVIKNIPISEGQRRIITCPFCYVSKKLSLSKIDGTIMWNCFRASCDAKGIHSSGRTIEYAKNYIIKAFDIKNKMSIIINHGISNKSVIKTLKSYGEKAPFRFLYIFSIYVYKNQWNVVEAVSKLRIKGYPVQLTLIGDIIYKPSGNLLNKAIKNVDPNHQFIEHILNVPHNEISEFYQNHDGIIFASSCENMPNILLESMGSGKPIACSNKSPMDEFLKDGGIYFNARSVNSIFSTLEKMLKSLKSFEALNHQNKEELKKYTWDYTSKETINFIKSTLKKYNDVQR